MLLPDMKRLLAILCIQANAGAANPVAFEKLVLVYANHLLAKARATSMTSGFTISAAMSSLPRVHCIVKSTICPAELLTSVE